MGSFAASVAAHVAKNKRLMDFVWRESVLRTIELAQTPVGAGGNLPVDTGFLRASLRVEVGDANFSITTPPEGGAAFSWDAGSVALSIAGSDISQPITAGWTAAYARRIEYGFVGQDGLGRTFNQSGRRFVGLAAQRWLTTVEEVVREGQARIK